MDPIALLCSHQQHLAATLERRSHCPVAPAVPLLVVIGTADSGQHIYIGYQSANDKRRMKNVVRLERQRMDELTSRYFAR